MTIYPTLSEAQAHPDVILCHFNGTEWEAYEAGETLPGPSLAQRQAAVWENIKALRDQLSREGGYPVTVSGTVYWFHSDPDSKTQQLALARKADRIEAVGGDLSAQFTGDSALWKTLSGAFVPMTGHLAQAIADAAEIQTGALFRAALTHKAWMESVVNPESYDFSGGWPEVYTP